MSATYLTTALTAWIVIAGSAAGALFIVKRRLWEASPGLIFGLFAVPFAIYATARLFGVAP